MYLQRILWWSSTAPNQPKKRVVGLS